MRDARTIGTSLLALLLWIGFAAPAEAQLCRGGPSFAALPYQVAAIAEFGDDTRGFGGDFFVGGRYLFGGAGFAVRDVESTNSTATEVTSRVGLDLPVSRVQRIHVCPSGFVSFGTGPDVGDVDVSTFRVGAGVRAGVAVRDTDFERGFIRAEVIKFEDYAVLGSESAVKAAGKMRVEGKEYVVQDGDVMHFRFNV
jgi:hypothetical protein